MKIYLADSANTLYTLTNDQRPTTNDQRLPMLKLYLFGSPQVILDEQALKIVRRKSRALLYYLAAQERPANREKLLEIFWPDLPRAEAQQTLRTNLYALRKALGEWLVADGNGFRWLTRPGWMRACWQRQFPAG